MPKIKKNNKKQQVYSKKYIYLVSNAINHLEKTTNILGKFKKPKNLEDLTQLTFSVKKHYQPHINGNVIEESLTTFNETILLCHRNGSSMVPFKHNNKSILVNITSEFDIYDLVWTNKKVTISLNNNTYDKLSQKISSNDSEEDDNKYEQMKLEEKMLENNDFEGEKLIDENDIIDLDIDRKINNVDEIENEEEKEEMIDEIKKLNKDLKEDENSTASKYKNTASDILKQLEEEILSKKSNKKKIIKLLKFDDKNRTNKSNNMKQEYDSDSSYDSDDSDDSPSSSFDQFELFNNIFDSVKENKDKSYNKSIKMKKTNNSIFTFKFGLCHQEKKIYLTEVKIILSK